MDDIKKTNKYGTMTSEGFVPHHPYGTGGKISLPVMLDININTVRAVMCYQPPLRIDNHLVFAKPGGGLFRSERIEVN